MGILEETKAGRARRPMKGTVIIGVHRVFFACGCAAPHKETPPRLENGPRQSDRRAGFTQMFVDGQLIREVPDSYRSFNNGGHPLVIGLSMERLDEHSPFKGAIDDIRIYRRALSSEEIAVLHNLPN